MLSYEPLHNVLQAATEARVQAASRALIAALAGQSAHLALARLKESGIIDEETAAHLALELNDQLVQESHPGGKVATVELELPAEVAPKELPEPKAKPKRRKKRSLDAEVVRFCPICLEDGVQTELSPGSCGCVKHWREVKRRQKGGNR